jgi:hypothetical protein
MVELRCSHPVRHGHVAEFGLRANTTNRTSGLCDSPGFGLRVAGPGIADQQCRAPRAERTPTSDPRAVMELQI